MKKKSIILTVLMLVLLLACGKESLPKNQKTSLAKQEQQISEGLYRAVLRPLNTRVYGMIPSGMANVSITGDNFDMKIVMDDAPRVVHRQHIHLGGSCPEPSADSNGDGYVDIQETTHKVGPAIVPLDSDLSSQSLGNNIFPAGDAYTYHESTSLSKMMDDLKAQDSNPDDSVIKLSAEDDLNLAGRVIIISGAPELTPLPPTVASNEGLPAQKTLPIACGVIERLETTAAVPLTR